MTRLELAAALWLAAGTLLVLLLRGAPGWIVPAFCAWTTGCGVLWWLLTRRAR